MRLAYIYTHIYISMYDMMPAKVTEEQKIKKKGEGIEDVWSSAAESRRFA